MHHVCNNMHILVQANGDRLICITTGGLGQGNIISIIFYQTGGSRIASIIQQVFCLCNIIHVNVHYTMFGKVVKIWKASRHPDHLDPFSIYCPWSSSKVSEFTLTETVLMCVETIAETRVLCRCKSPITRLCPQQFAQADNKSPHCWPLVRWFKIIEQNMLRCTIHWYCISINFHYTE